MRTRRKGSRRPRFIHKLWALRRVRLGLPGPILVVLLVLTSSAAQGCASAGGALTEAELKELAARRGLPAAEVHLPFRSDAEMVRWLDENVPIRHRPEMRVERLLEALLRPDGLGLTYDPSFTGTASEAFRQGRANCLGFTNLFVALAREMDVPVYFLAVDEVEAFQRQESEDLVVISRHVTAGYGPGHDLKVLEFTLGPSVDYRSARRISDRTAVALYYSNRGAELLRAGDVEAARQTLATAVAIDPELPLAWVNLGVARRRAGDLEGAEAAYHRSLEAEPRTVSAYQNLAALARQRGDGAAASRLLAVIPHLRSRNPYNYLTLGDDALARGRRDQARDFYRRAHRLFRGHAEPMAALGLLALLEGDSRAAERWLRRASRLDAEQPRVERLRRRLAAGGAAPARR